MGVITLAEYLIAIGAAIAGGYAILWILNLVHEEKGVKQ